MVDWPKADLSKWQALADRETGSRASELVWTTGATSDTLGFDTQTPTQLTVTITTSAATSGPHFLYVSNGAGLESNTIPYTIP